MAEAVAQDVTLRLVPIAGPTVEPPVLNGEGILTIGRSASCEIMLADPMVSRRHLSVIYRGGMWFVTDLGSRHATLLNGNPIKANTPTGLAEQDLLGIGPWTFRVTVGDHVSHATSTTDDTLVAAGRVERLTANELGSLAQQRLQLLIDCSARIHNASDELELAESVLDSAIAGSGFYRAAMVRPLGDGEEVEVVSYRDVAGTGGEAEFSRSLLTEAAGGNFVRLASDAAPRFGDSIVSLSIHSAICAPIFLGPTVAACLYMDARGDESSVQPDAASFCQAVARIAGLALANIKRGELEIRQLRLDADLAAAREAQQFIVPSGTGAMGSLRYAVQMRPGRIVAGDLFDITDLEDGRFAVVIGDVTGEGVGAGILMATTQAHLHAALSRFGDPADALNAVNPYIAERSPADRFVSLWVGIFDTKNSKLTYVDAGHGHWVHVRSAEAPLSTRPNCMLAGIDPTYEYSSVERQIAPNDRVVLFSDGIIEQPSTEGEQFGMKRVMEMVKECADCEDDVRAVFEAVEKFGGVTELADDATVASIEWVGAE